MTDAVAMIRMIRYDGTRVTEADDASYRIEVWTREALAESILRVAGYTDASRREVAAFAAFLPLGRFAFTVNEIGRWRELYRASENIGVN